jgi:hypothetical protein
MLLVGAVKGKKNSKHKNDYKAVWNSVIIEGDKGKFKSKTRHGKRPEMNTLQRKFTNKNKRESDSLIVYNEDYKDNASRKRHTVTSSNKRASGSRRAGKESKNEGRMSSRRPMKSHVGHKNSHKRSHSLNKSTIDQRYKSVPQNGYNYDHEQTKKSHAKKKLNWFFNNRTPQVHLSKTKAVDACLDLSMRNAKKSLQNYFREGNHEYNKKKFASLTGREKGNALLRKVYLRKEQDYPTNISFHGMVITTQIDWHSFYRKIKGLHLLKSEK